MPAPPKKKTEHFDPWVVKASPTKELFIYMLIRDLMLRDAISDLVDNSVDAVRSLVERELPNRPAKALSSRRYEGFRLKLDFDENHFIIEDNCGGLEAKEAREYAFRFGRDKGAPPTPGSIGQFGIGMKRALFKLGRHFTVTSVAEKSRFVIKVDVNAWAADESHWDFKFDELTENENNPLESRMMRIEVTQLNADVAALFRPGARNLFESNLMGDVSREHMYTISNGMDIKVNGSNLPSVRLELLESEEFKVGAYDKTFSEREMETGLAGDVRVRIRVGVHDKVLREGGWYIFCNDRLVVGSDQTSVTGWTGGGSGGGLPIYHDQFARFRGYVFFDSPNAGLLPWNTTKTSMNMDSKLYQQIRAEMIAMARPVITFLNALKRENESTNASQQKPLHKAISSAKSVAVLAVPPERQARQFVAPKPQVTRTAPKEQAVKYTVAVEDFSRVQEHLGVARDEVGPATFLYYLRNEVG